MDGWMHGWMDGWMDGWMHGFSTVFMVVIKRLMVTVNILFYYLHTFLKCPLIVFLAKMS